MYMPDSFMWVLLDSNDQHVYEILHIFTSDIENAVQENQWTDIF